MAGVGRLIRIGLIVASVGPGLWVSWDDGRRLWNYIVRGRFCLRSLVRYGWVWVRLWGSWVDGRRLLLSMSGGLVWVLWDLR